MAAVDPHGLDLCSGVRTGGRLDSGKLTSFVAAVRSGQCDWNGESTRVPV